MHILNTRKIFSVFGTKRKLILCLNSQTEMIFFILHNINSVKKTKNRFVKKTMDSFTKSEHKFLVNLTLRSQIIYSIYASFFTAYYICNRLNQTKKDTKSTNL